MRRRLALVAVVPLLLAGCAKESRGTLDAPIKHPSDNRPAEVINFPNQFMNVATKCDHGNRIYSHTREGAPVVVPADPSCPQEIAR